MKWLTILLSTLFVVSCGGGGSDAPIVDNDTPAPSNSTAIVIGQSVFDDVTLD